MSLRTRAARLAASAAITAILAVTAGGCSLTSRDTTASVAAQTPTNEAEWRRSLDALGAKYRENPNDADAAIAYARAVRPTDQPPQAVAVLEQASIRNPRYMPLIGAYGRGLADVNQYKQALETLDRAHSPDNPDWRILNVQGAVLDQMGRHNEAQAHYAAALKIIPDEPSVLSNLRLSYLLTKDLAKAEDTLRRAAAQLNAGPKVRQNLALAVALRGRFDEAEKIASADLPEAEAVANVNYLRQMMAQTQQQQQQQQPPRNLKKVGRAATPMPTPDAGS